MTLEICSQCHPYFSGKQIYVDTAGRVEKFQRRYGSLTGAKQEAATAKKAVPQPPQQKSEPAGETTQPKKPATKPKAAQPAKAEASAPTN
jgi:hypothetical protein